ncbi:hypothetical protein P7K49_003322 [Saguinus oedipus]|uniref:Mitogen-activated protein kinase 11 n=1 Tax=Saguinus oedipus TaxID=9490 RepID=A0ABQ9WJU2_SAGOE|nr:hypothetical protein P7K49_003322 [Saguinus oedipus]
MSGPRAGFYRQELNKTVWEVPQRLQGLRPVGSGAYGSVCAPPPRPRGVLGVGRGLALPPPPGAARIRGMNGGWRKETFQADAAPDSERPPLGLIPGGSQSA